jgi:hypothetical protein
MQVFPLRNGSIRFVRGQQPARALFEEVIMEEKVGRQPSGQQLQQKLKLDRIDGIDEPDLRGGAAEQTRS